jgi:hypothetical protein
MDKNGHTEFEHTVSACVQNNGMRLVIPQNTLSDLTGSAMASKMLNDRSERTNSMTKPLDHVDEVIRNTKHPFRQVGDRPDKPHKHRYERRKIREFIRTGEWSAEK